MKRYDWWDWWQQRKDDYLLSDEPFLDRDRFASLCVGTGLPDIHQRSTFSKSISSGKLLFTIGCGQAIAHIMRLMFASGMAASQVAIPRAPPEPGSMESYR